jgi:dihydropteroate synthase
MPSEHWHITRGVLSLSRPLVMGIVNVTPDSFSDGGLYASCAAALAYCERQVKEGADILDIGGESTRPGAQAPNVEVELQRVLPVLRGALQLGVPVSVDTSQAEVMQEALDLGADIINDVRAFRRPGALQAVAAHAKAGLCLMHMKGEPGTMQDQALHAVYTDVVAEVRTALASRLQELVARGIKPERVVLDPGIGFAKTPEHNLALLRRQNELLSLGRPLLLGWSRKSTLGTITGRAAGDRLASSVAAALLAAQRGAAVLRVHDVAATVDALKVWQAASQVD